MSWLALDVGGANLKVADGLGYAASVPFALWKSPGELSTRLAELISSAPPAERIALTMTGELCDCFATKAEGVAAILNAVEEAGGDRETLVYLTDGRLVPVAEARAHLLLAAASNWHALAVFACRYCAAFGFVIDVGSTTTDIVPLRPSGPLAVGSTDFERMNTGSLLYVGVDRTPLCAYPHGGGMKSRGNFPPLAAELFATAADAYLLLHDLDEEPENIDTADGRPRTYAAAQARIARMICQDTTTFSHRDAVAFAELFQNHHMGAIVRGIEGFRDRSVKELPQIFVLAGQGEFLARRAMKLTGLLPILSLSEQIGPMASRCAPAHALAVLARERAGESVAR